jgi:hypothetical protein
MSPEQPEELRPSEPERAGDAPCPAADQQDRGGTDPDDHGARQDRPRTADDAGDACAVGTASTGGGLRRFCTWRLATTRTRSAATVMAHDPAQPTEFDSRIGWKAGRRRGVLNGLGG